MNPQIIKGQSYKNHDHRTTVWSSANPVWKAPAIGFRTFRSAKKVSP